MVGRPRKCPYCGSTATSRKGRRRTKTMGDRAIFRCKSCRRKFTPQNQKLDEKMETHTADPQRSAPVSAEPNELPVGSEAVDHPRY